MIDIEKLRTAANAIYLAAPEEVAKDISNMLNQAADELKRLREERRLKGLHISKERLRELIENEDELKRIDWSRMPRCRVEFEGKQYFFEKWSKVNRVQLREFEYPNGELGGFRITPNKEIKLLPDLEWRPWRGGECPVPEGVMVELLHRDGKITKTTNETFVRWYYHSSAGNNDIIAYKITGGLADT